MQTKQMEQKLVNGAQFPWPIAVPCDPNCAQLWAFSANVLLYDVFPAKLVSVKMLK
jgi:hypothetical protein